MIVPIEKIKVLDMLPSYILAGAIKRTKYYLDISRVNDLHLSCPYVWVIRYTTSDKEDTYCMVHDKDLYSVTLTMLSWLDGHKEEFDTGYEQKQII